MLTKLVHIIYVLRLALVGGADFDSALRIRRGLNAITLVLGALIFVCNSSVRAADVTFESGPTRVHLLELFTSEGCSSCPPAEAWLSQLKSHPALWRDFVPLAFHVDYWDYLGWRDRFASKEWTARQRDYADQWNSTSVYTPGFVLDGKESIGRATPKKSDEAGGHMRITWANNNALISFDPAKRDLNGYEVHLAQLGFGVSSNVAAGENRGRKLVHDFVVLALQTGSLGTEAGETRITIQDSSADKPGAIAAWITLKNDLTPIQACGGWLGKN